MTASLFPCPCFSINIPPCVKTETTEAVSASLSCACFLPSCRSKSPLPKWLEWMRGHSIWGRRRTMRAVAMIESLLVAFYEQRWSIGWIGLREGKCWYVVVNFCFLSATHIVKVVKFSAVLAVSLPCYLLHLLPLYSVPFATVSKVPIPKGWRRVAVMSSMHNSTPVIHGLLSQPLCHCHLFLSVLHL